MKFRSYKKKKIGKYFSRAIIIISLSLISSLIVINYFSHKSSEILLPMAEGKLRRVVTGLINESTRDFKFDEDLFVLVKDSDNEIKMVNYNSYEVTKLIKYLTLNIEKRLDELYVSNSEEKFSRYLIQEIPFGAIFGDSFLSGLGPKIKIKSEVIGSMISNIETEVKPYGINNAYVETRISLEVRAKIYLPFVSKDIIIKNVVPISMNIVQGSVPNGYITSYK